MSLFPKRTEEPSDVHYEGNVILRMLSYLRPHVGKMAVCLALVLVITLAGPPLYSFFSAGMTSWLLTMSR